MEDSAAQTEDRRFVRSYGTAQPADALQMQAIA